MIYSSADVTVMVIDELLGVSDDHTPFDLMSFIFRNSHPVQNKAIHTVANRLETLGIIQRVDDVDTLAYVIRQRPALAYLNDYPPNNWHTPSELLDVDDFVEIEEHLSQLIGKMPREDIIDQMGILGYPRPVVDEILQSMKTSWC